MQDTDNTINNIKNNTTPTTRCGFIAVVGRPSAGKSTLLNTLCKHEASIVSQYPQTTRDIIRIIVSTEHTQYIFLDSPGYHLSEKKFNQQLVSKITKVINNCDVILYLIDLSRKAGQEEYALFHVLEQANKKKNKAIVLAFTKTDLLEQAEKNTTNIKNYKTETISSQKQSLLSTSPEHIIEKTISMHPITQMIKKKSYQVHLVGISSLQTYGLHTLLNVISEQLPQDHFHYPTEYYTDQESDFRICEQVRAAAIYYLRQELPHALNTRLVESTILNTNKEGKASTIAVKVEIIVDTKSQLAIVVGKGGCMIANIRRKASKRINGIFEFSVTLQLKVRIQKNWRNASIRSFIQ